jgi:hypothetical protein
MDNILTKYGYSIGQIVQTRYNLYDENQNEIPAGTRIRIVAIAPKVRIITGDELHDRREYFYNAILADQTEPDYMNRIRANFCTIRKIK